MRKWGENGGKRLKDVETNIERRWKEGSDYQREIEVREREVKKVIRKERINKD